MSEAELEMFVPAFRALGALGGERSVYGSTAAVQAGAARTAIDDGGVQIVLLGSRGSPVSPVATVFRFAGTVGNSCMLSRHSGLASSRSKEQVGG
jgi:hypothetical protein